MRQHTTLSLCREFAEDVEECLKDEPFGSVKEFVKPVLVHEMEFGDEIFETEPRRIS
jgi:hypothetical protein